MKIEPLPLLGILMFLSACSTDTTVQIERHPVIQFNYNNTTWKADNYFFVGPAQVVAYPSNSNQPGRLYNRYTLQAYGKDANGNNLQLNIGFDSSDPSQLIGVYRPAYTTEKGLAQVQLFNLDKNSLAAYELCESDTSAVLQVKRQSETEQLVAGDFHMIVCNTRDTTQKIAISDGVITDIHY